MATTEPSRVRGTSEGPPAGPGEESSSSPPSPSEGPLGNCGAPPSAPRSRDRGLGELSARSGRPWRTVGGRGGERGQGGHLASPPASAPVSMGLSPGNGRRGQSQAAGAGAPPARPGLPSPQQEVEVAGARDSQSGGWRPPAASAASGPAASGVRRWSWRRWSQ